jgi:hypothetical protein
MSPYHLGWLCRLNPRLIERACRGGLPHCVTGRNRARGRAWQARHYGDLLAAVCIKPGCSFRPIDVTMVAM